MNKSSDFHVFKQLINLDIEKEKINIFFDPPSFFNKILADITDPTIKKMFKINVFFVLRKISAAVNDLESDKAIMLRAKDMKNFINITYRFYDYALECLRFVIKEQDDMILDCYNENKINKEEMIEFLKKAQERRSDLMNEEKETTKTLEAITKIKEELANSN